MADTLSAWFALNLLFAGMLALRRRGEMPPARHIRRNVRLAGLALTLAGLGLSARAMLRLAIPA